MLYIEGKRGIAPDSKMKELEMAQISFHDEAGMPHYNVNVEDAKLDGRMLTYRTITGNTHRTLVSADDAALLRSMIENPNGYGKLAPSTYMPDNTRKNYNTILFIQVLLSIVLPIVSLILAYFVFGNIRLTFPVAILGICSSFLFIRAIRNR